MADPTDLLLLLIFPFAAVLWLLIADRFGWIPAEVQQ